jgi:uncharacterized Fe-S radical SAM superfamily protein PflX
MRATGPPGAPAAGDEFRPAYMALLASDELDRRVEVAWAHLEDCDLCARYCHVNRGQQLRRPPRRGGPTPGLGRVGDLQIDRRGLARRGLLVRHLVLPGGIAGTENVLAFLARDISRDTYLNLMDQYDPCHRAWDAPPLDRPITRDEYERALALADAHGLHRLDRPRRWPVRA